MKQTLHVSFWHLADSFPPGTECLLSWVKQTSLTPRFKADRFFGLLTCRFRKFHPTWIRIVRQNHRILEAMFAKHHRFSHAQFDGP
jgi:hypothetical protein